jgi:hypothetical protein
MKRQKSSHRRIRRGLLILFLSLPFTVNAQGDKPDSLAQYLFPSFTKCSVLTKNGTSYTLLLNYNIVSEKMVFIQKETYFDLANPETVDTVFLGKSRFVPRESYFLEVITGGRVSIFRRNKGQLTAPPRPAGYGTTTDLTSSNLLVGLNTPQGYYNFKLPEGYTVRQVSSFWVGIDDKWTRFTTENQFLKAFDEKEKDIKAYIKAGRLHINNPEELVKIGNYCNDITK